MFAMRMISLAAAGLAALALVGCSATGGQPQSATRDRNAALEDAFVVAPVGGPQVLQVVERRYPNATEQRITLANRSGAPGSNFLLVQYFGPVGNTGTGRTPLANPSLRTGDLAAEIRAAVPGVPMRQSPLFVQNRYGPFGYAAGRTPGGDTCIYAWQRIAGVDNSTLLLRDRGTIQIRLRLCDGAASEESLLHSMYGLTIRAFFSNLSWNPYGPPPLADPRLGRIGAPILPQGARGFEAVVSEPAPAAAPAPRRAAPRPAPAAPAPVQPAVAAPVVQALPAPIGPLVPPPPPALPAAPPTDIAAPAPVAPASVPTPPPAGSAASSTACTAAAREAGRC